MIGYPHRLLESYALVRTRGLLDLHGGAAEFVAGSDARDISARSWAIAGRSYALRVKVLVYLDDVPLCLRTVAWLILKGRTKRNSRSIEPFPAVDAKPPTSCARSRCVPGMRSG